MIGFYETLTDPDEPLSIEDAKAFMRVETDADDDLIGIMIKTARESAELLTNRLFREVDMRVFFPGSCGYYNTICRSPLKTTGVTVTQWNSETRSYEAVTGVSVIPSNGFGKVRYTDAISQPPDTEYGVKIEFTAGYATLPPALLGALKMHVAYLYENRGDVEAVGGVKLPAAVNMIYRQYRIIATYG